VHHEILDELVFPVHSWHSDQVVRVNPPPLGKLIPRHAEASVNEALADIRVVLITGARQCGDSAVRLRALTSLIA
jgi:hypothetical protein